MPEQGYLIQALIYLAAGVIFVPVFKRLGLGSVLGFLVAGVAIGPWGLGLVKRPEAILHFAELGVVLLLFLVGLELNPRRVWQMRKAIFGMGAAQVVSTVAAVAAAGWALGLDWKVALVAGMGLAMSSTAIGLASLQDKNLLPTPGGQASFAVLLFQDLAVIPLLLLLGFMQARGSAAGLDWNWVITAVSVVVALIAGGRLLLRPVLRYVANTRQRDIFVGFSLLLVLGIAALMEHVGLSMALGAFLGGVLLADSEYRHELELDIDPFKGLLLGLFFMAVGMSVDMGLLLRSPLLVLGVVLGIVALKMLVLYPTAQLFGYCGRADAGLFAVALSQAGEFAFVLFAAAGDILPRATRDLLTAAVAVSMLSTPLLMMLYERVFARRMDDDRAPDAIHEQNPVVIAGFGRFGQIVARVLDGMKVGRTIVDSDPNQIEAVRRFGSMAYYGDATRLNVLEAAGARKAKLLVVAVDGEENAMRIVKLARQHFRHLKIIVRAHGRTDAFEYHEMGVPAVRETFGSALDAAELALQALDHGPVAARRVVTRFRRHDEELLAEQAPHRNETKRLIAVSLQGRADLDRVLSREALGAPAKTAR
jgi:monovalent cation:proton antiporter-2 (CPA2) family protein